MLPYYARNGDELTLEQWAALMEDDAYKIVVQENVGPYWVSTIWLGLDYNLFDGPPLIFETMVFFQGKQEPAIEWGGMDCYRWPTEDAAKAGHEEVCTLVRATMQEDLPDLGTARDRDVCHEPGEEHP